MEEKRELVDTEAQPSEITFTISDLEKYVEIAINMLDGNPMMPLEWNRGGIHALSLLLEKFPYFHSR